MESRLEIILNGISDGVTVLDSQGKFVYANEIGARMCGFSTVEEFLKVSTTEVMERFEILDEAGNPFPIEKLPGRLALAGVQEPPEVIVCSRLKKTGEARWSLVKARPVFDETRNAWLAVSIFKDFTERKRAEEALKYLDESSRVLASSLDYERTLAQIAKLAVPRLADWCVVYVVDEGKPLESLIVAHADPAKETLAAEFKRRHKSRLDADCGDGRAIRTEQSRLFPEVTLAMLEGRALDADHLRVLKELGVKSAMCVPLRTQSRTFGALNFMSAESGRRYGEQDLIVAEELGRRAGLAVENARLYRASQEAIQTRDEFLSIASHELKTPVTSLRLQIQILQRLAQEGELGSTRGLRMVEAAAKSSLRMESMVDELLDMARIRAGKMRLEREEVNLTLLTENVLAQWMGSEIHFRAPSQAIVGFWDGLRLEQVLTNLVSNAIKYGGGKPVDIGLERGDGAVRLRVHDNGIGISKEMQEKIFERFERVVGSTNISGLGLGLYIVRQIVEAHGGSVRVQSELGAGSTFTVEIPLNPN